MNNKHNKLFGKLHVIRTLEERRKHGKGIGCELDVQMGGAEGKSSFNIQCIFLSSIVHWRNNISKRVKCEIYNKNEKLTIKYIPK